jgi:hypothetical protein
MTLRYDLVVEGHHKNQCEAMLIHVVCLLTALAYRTAATATATAQYMNCITYNMMISAHVIAKLMINTARSRFTVLLQ